jgi:hypothetical protein
MHPPRGHTAVPPRRTQVWDAVAGSSDALDLVNFERQQAKLRVGISF